MKKTESVIIAGDGNGIKYLYEGLCCSFNTIYIYTNTPEFINKREADHFINDFFENDTNLVICSAYAPLIKKDILEQKDFLNIHYAPLPRFRGMHPIVWGIINDEPHFGLTLHKIDEHMDSGDIIYQYTALNDGISTSVDYMNLFHEKVKENIGDAVLKYISGNIKAQPQDKSLATWGCKRNLEDCRIDFNWANKKIKNFFRALVAPYPLPFFIFKEKKYFLKNYHIHTQNIEELTLGRITNIDNEGIWIKIKEGYLVSNDIVDEFNQPTNIKETFRIGSRL